MPFYEYQCPHCGYVHTEQRPIAKRDARMTCVVCNEPMVRIVSATAGFVRDPAVPRKYLRNKSNQSRFS